MLLGFLAGCATSVPPSPPEKLPSVTTGVPVEVKPTPTVPLASQEPPAPVFRQVTWDALPGWREDNIAEAWSAFAAGCSALATRDVWRDVCAASSRLVNPSPEAVRLFFESNFVPYQVSSQSSGEEGLITGYYEPLLRGSRKQTPRYRYPVYGVPEDLVVVDLGELYPELKNMRLRGRIEGRRLVPYYDRARIEGGEAPLRGKEIVWVDDAVELFFLHVQGSGRILLDTGETLRVGYADQNGYPYRSIGRVLIDRGELSPEQVSMQSIQAWARRNPTKAVELLNSNASYVFFRELPASVAGPPGSLGVPLTARRSVAIDPRYVPLGAPVFIAATWPNSPKPLNRLVLAQDTGGAIRGPVRADFFWGYGEAAAREAGRMKQRLRMWMLWPRNQPLPAVTSD
jgi:peptidoglycan lytic transglycosylase A